MHQWSVRDRKNTFRFEELFGRLRSDVTTDWMPEYDPMISSFGDDDVKNGIQAPHVAASSEKERFRHK
jgi:hypothetical protein